MKILMKFLKRKLFPTYLIWYLKGRAAPAPNRIKQRTLSKFAIRDGDWIETGTYLGDTAKFLGTRYAGQKIITLEPQLELYNFSKKRLRKHGNVRVINSTSENSLAAAIESLSDKINFWLDGHFSGDITFLGERVTPVEFELKLISDYLKLNSKVVIYVDDFRLFGLDSTYPKKDFLSNWACENLLEWTVENDIFIAYSKP